MFPVGFACIYNLSHRDFLFYYDGIQALPGSTVLFFQKSDVVTIPRAVYAAFIALFVIIAVVAYVVDHFLMVNIAKAGKIKKTYTF